MKTIAVLDDDVEFLAIMGELIVEQGYEARLHKFDTTEHAFQLLQADVPDLAILDLRVGDYNDGMEVLKLMRSDPKTSEVPVIMCTADSLFLSEKRDVLRQLNSQPLEKPFAIGELLLMIQRIVGRP